VPPPVILADFRKRRWRKKAPENPDEEAQKPDHQSPESEPMNPEDDPDPRK
jgi:hypothetical protein